MKKMILFVAVILISLTQIQCKKDNPVAPPSSGGTSDNITTGTIVTLTSQPVSSGGGTITISKPGDTLNGFTIIVPPNSFTMTQNISVSYSPIMSHKFGINFNPITPLIHVECDGGVSNHPILLKIPVKITAGRFQMPFLFDKSTGKLTPMMIQEIGTNYVLVSTRYFSPTGQLSKTGNIHTITYADFAVSDIDEAKLAAQNIIDSGYRPGTDDWEFINWGSYIAPGGHCAGQSITSMWYYIEKKMNGAFSLYHQLDTYNDLAHPDTLWQDNPKGYRFASSIQGDFNCDDWLEDIGAQSKHPDITFKAFAYSVLISKEPQLVFIAHTTPDTVGHAMVVYKIDYSGKKLYVADPNYPNNRTVNGTISERVINYTGSQLGPYTSGATAANLGTVFNQIGFYPKSCYIKWSQITQRWQDLLNGTIGDDKFPHYTLILDSIGGNILTDNYITYDFYIKVLNRSTECDSALNFKDKLQKLDAFNDHGQSMVYYLGSLNGSYEIDLKPGNNKIGFYIMGRKSYGGDCFVDFKWFNIIRNDVTFNITPDPLNGVLNNSYSFTANINTGQLPTKYRCEWDFRDGTPKVTVQNSLTVQHTFTTEGVFDINCAVYDNTTNKYIARAGSQANILSAFLTDLLASRIANFHLMVEFKSNNMNVGLPNYLDLGNSQAHITAGNNIIWNGLSFSTHYTYKTAPLTGTDSLVCTGSVSGTFSSDGMILLSFAARERKQLQSGTSSWTDDSVTVANLHFSPNSNNQKLYRNTGPNVASNVTFVSLKRWLFDSNTGVYELVTNASQNYNSTSTNPDLYIIMNK
jgi:hypothetical protein